MDEFISCIQSQQPVDAVDFRIRRKDMRSRWVRMAFLTEQCPNNTNTFEVEGFLEDITEQKEMEIQICQANKRYERMASNVPGLVFHCLLQIDGSLRFTFISPSCRQLFNLEPEQICTDSELLLKSFLPEDLAKLYRSIAESTASLEPFTWQGVWQHDDKRLWFQVNARPERLDDGQVRWDGVMIDITAMKEAEQSAQFLAMFPAENPNPELRISKDGVIIYANPAAKLLLDSWQRAAGQQAPEDIIESVANTIHSGRTTTTETSCSDRYFSVMFVPVSQDEAVNLYARDITEAKTAELELQETKRKMAEHDKLKGEFISTITHELRTPLCIFKNIISNTLAGVNGPVTPKLQENLEMAQKSVERLKNIISDFMDISEIDAGKTKLDRKITFMQDLIKQTVESMRPLAAAKKISVTMNMPKKPVFADIDQSRIVKVLENIIGNAIKFINVKCSIYVTLTDYLNGEFFDVCVRDDGPGMTKKEAAKVFDRFVQARILKGPGKHGTGLGLTVAREIINLHGGHIWVETEPKQGCAFFFRLPKAKEKTVAAPAAATPASQS